MPLGCPLRASAQHVSGVCARGHVLFVALRLSSIRSTTLRRMLARPTRMCAPRQRRCVIHTACVVTPVVTLKNSAKAPAVTAFTSVSLVDPALRIATRVACKMLRASIHGQCNQEPGSRTGSGVIIDALPAICPTTTPCCRRASVRQSHCVSLTIMRISSEPKKCM